MKSLLFLGLLFFLSFTNTIAKKSDHADAIVVRVIDGDTIKVKLNSGKYINVRLIGVDTPETKAKWLPEKNSAKVPQYFGTEATYFVEHILKRRQKVALTLDNHHPIFDKYDRLLAYVKTTLKNEDYDDYLSQTMHCDRHKNCSTDIDLNLELNRLGFSKCYKKFKHPRLKEFLAACEAAKKQRVGVYQKTTISKIH